MRAVLLTAKNSCKRVNSANELFIDVRTFAIYAHPAVRKSQDLHALVVEGVWSDKTALLEGFGVFATENPVLVW